VERFQGEQSSQGVRYNLVEATPEHTFVTLFGTNDLLITIEQIFEPFNLQPFQGVLDSAYLKIVSPAATDRLESHKSAVLIDVSHGTMPDEEKTNALLDQVGLGHSGQSSDEFLLRLETLKALTRAYGEQREPLLVHWTQSNQLLDFQTFATLSGEAMPSLLNIHPQLYSDKTNAKGQWIGFTTFGAAHFLGREITFKSAPIAWGNLYEYALTFLRFCSSKEGYTVPHGDCFSDGEGLSIAVRHIPDRADGSAATYELTLLQSTKFGYECPPDLVPALGDDGDDPFPDLNPEDPVDRAILQRLAERGDTVIEERVAIVDEQVEEPAPMIARGSGFGRRQAPPAA
ncbi:MAG: hypothetical protein ACR2PF_12395, partial [Rhizobiaceae bacterium]